MNTNTILLIGLSAILLVLLIVFVVKRKSDETPTNYRALFIIGIAFLPIGISTKNYAFTAIGTIFMIVGLVNKSKWEKPKKFAEMTYDERRLKITLLIFASLIFIFGILAYFLAS